MIINKFKLYKLFLKCLLLSFNENTTAHTVFNLGTDAKTEMTIH